MLPDGARASSGRFLEVFSARLNDIESFFCSAGLERVTTLLRQLEEKSSDPQRQSGPPRTGSTDVPQHASRLWVTRPRPGVDRDGLRVAHQAARGPHARFAFAADPKGESGNN